MTEKNVFAFVALLLVCVGWLLVVGATFDPCAPIRTTARAEMIRAGGLDALGGYFISDAMLDAEAAAEGHPLSAMACLKYDLTLTMRERP